MVGDTSLLEYIKYALLLISALACIKLLFDNRRSKLNLPPGPLGWPFIGILPQLLIAERNDVDLHTLMMNFSQKYGKVFSFRSGKKLVVILNDQKSAKEAFNSPHITDRDRRGGGTRKPAKNAGLIRSGGVVWREHRRFFLTHLRNFGMGKLSFENRVTTEASFLIKSMFEACAQPFDPHRLLSNATANVISAVVCGKRYDYDDEDFDRLLSEVTTNLNASGNVGITLSKFVAYMINIVYKKGRMKHKNWKSLSDRWQKIIDQHREVNVQPENVRDIIDAYLIEMSQRDEDFLKLANFNLKTLVVDIHNLFAAGMDTSSNTLGWALLYMATYPHIQKRIQDELDRVVGRDRLPAESDRFMLPFVDATILEVSRIRTIVPMGGDHCASSDTTIQGYDIPKGTVVFANLWGIHHDPDIWEEPDEFKPERFLGDDGRVIVSDNLIPFGVGRRVCIGEKIAKLELFIFFTHLLHKFSFKIPEGSPPPSLEGDLGVTYSPEPFKIRVIPRS